MIFFSLSFFLFLLGVYYKEEAVQSISACNELSSYF